MDTSDHIRSWGIEYIRKDETIPSEVKKSLGKIWKNVHSQLQRIQILKAVRVYIRLVSNETNDETERIRRVLEKINSIVDEVKRKSKEIKKIDLTSFVKEGPISIRHGRYPEMSDQDYEGESIDIEVDMQGGNEVIDNRVPDA